jgi:CheY-like chemotaxis protein
MASQTILIVDDSRVIRMQVMDMLPKGNFEVLEAKDGVEGLELIRQHHPNLVLLDFFMPRMNGWEVVQQMQQHSDLQSIPVVMMSGRRDDVVNAVPELFEYFEFLSKPFEQTLLVKAIKSAVSKAKGRQALPIMPKVAAASSNGATTIAPAPPSTPAPPATPSPAVGGDRQDEMLLLKEQINQLHSQNARLYKELNTLKKQVAQIAAVLRQKVT